VKRSCCGCCFEAAPGAGAGDARLEHVRHRGRTGPLCALHDGPEAVADPVAVDLASRPTTVASDGILSHCMTVAVFHLAEVKCKTPRFLHLAS
jgi:hypothetical protein